MPLTDASHSAVSSTWVVTEAWEGHLDDKEGIGKREIGNVVAYVGSVTASSRVNAASYCGLSRRPDRLTRFLRARPLRYEGVEVVVAGLNNSLVHVQDDSIFCRCMQYCVVWD